MYPKYGEAQYKNIFLKKLFYYIDIKNKFKKNKKKYFIIFSNKKYFE
jgi:hypothetical protein